MTILLTGGTGKTCTHMIPRFLSSHTPFLLTSRTPSPNSPHPIVQFDFTDPSTYSNPFTHPSIAVTNNPISAIYLIAPLAATDPAGVTNAFITYAYETHRVKRFVFLTGTTTVKGSEHGVGKVWEKLDLLKEGDESVEYCVLAATWFMENLTSPMRHLRTIRNTHTLHSACGSGQVAYISTETIAHVAYKILTSPSFTLPLKLPTHIPLHGPTLHSMNDIASILTRITGHEITHIELTPAQRIASYMDLGFQANAAAFMTSLEVRTAEGEEAVLGDGVESVIGEKGVGFEEWAGERRSVWG